MMQQTEKMDEIEKLLSDFVALYNEAKENINSPKVKDAVVKLAEDYCEIVNHNIDLFSVLDREFAGDSQLYVLVLSALFFISKDRVLLDKVEELLFLDHLPTDASLRILAQVVTNRFSNGFPLSEYSHARKLHLHLLRRLEKELNMSWEYIPYEERNHNLIILETDTLLSDNHAPTRLVMEIYQRLKYEMGYDVYLLVDFLRMDTDNMEGYWMFPYRARYLPELDEEFVREYAGREMIGYQQVIWENQLASIQNSIDIVRAKKPEFVWHIGGQSVLSDLFAKVTTLVSMPCTDGYAVSEAPVLVSYAQTDGEWAKSMEEYNVSHSQKMVQIDSIMTLNLPSGSSQARKKYSHEDFGIPADSFVAAIVGNRLDTEITEEFIAVMEEIAAREEDVYFVIIGKCETKRWNTVKLKDRVAYLGFQEDLLGVLGATELFLNPPRQGGGGGAAYAAYAGVPVLTLGNCDVANVGEEFVCDSLEMFPEMVSRYRHDREFYQAQVACCKKLQEKTDNIDRCLEVKKIISQVEELYRQGM